MTKLTRAEIVKNKSLCKMIKPLKVFRNNQSGKRFTVQHVRMEPIDNGIKWYIDCSTMVNKRPVIFEMQFEELANGLILNPETNLGLFTALN